MAKTTLTNGVLDGAVLLVLAAGNSGARLRFGTAHRWAKVRNEVERRYGWLPEITSSVDGYRPLEVQERIFFQRYSLTDSGWRGAGHVKFYAGKNYYIRTNPATKRPYAVAATPGSSNHGLAKTVDVVNLPLGSKRHAQFADVATELGFSNEEGESIGEGWHWVDTLDPDDALDGSTPPTAASQEDDDMPTMVEFLNYPAFDGGPSISQVLKDLAAVPAGLYTGGPAVDDPTPGSIVALIRAIPERVWATPVRRGDTSVPALQELADAKTLGQAILTLLQQAGPGDDVDEAALAAALAPLVSAGVRSLSDADVAKVAKAAADEQDRRDRERLA